MLTLAGTHKLTHLSTAQKNDWFLAFKSKDDNRGILSKIARYLDMGLRYLSIIVQNSKLFGQAANLNSDHGKLCLTMGNCV